MLLEKEAKVNEPNGAGVTPFAMAASSWSGNMTEDQVEVSKLLLLYGANANEQIGGNRSPALQAAISHGLADLVELLCGYDADPMAKDNMGQSAFDIARLAMETGRTTKEGHVKIMQQLFDAIDQDIPQEADVCPIVTAVRSADLETANSLFKLGADPNHRINAERQPLLHIAIEHGDLMTVKFLIEHGARITPPNCRGYSAIEHTQAVGAKGIEEHLRGT